MFGKLKTSNAVGSKYWEPINLMALPRAKWLMAKKNSRINNSIFCLNSQVKYM